MPIPANLAATAAKLSAEDQALLDGIFSRSPDFTTELTTRAEIFDAFVGGDTARLPDTTGARPGSALADLSSLASTVEARVSARYDQQFNEFKTKVDSLDVVKQATEIADRIFAEKSKAFEAEVLGKAAKTSDSIYQVRRNHEREFGTELDTNKFTEFINAHPGYTSIEAAHDAMVQDDRIKMQIEKGVQERLASQQTAAVPGTELPTNGPLGQFVKDNEKRFAATSGTASRGQGIDDAVKAFQTLRSQHANA